MSEVNCLLIQEQKGGMIASLVTFLDITEDELFRYIDYAANKTQPDSLACNTDVFKEELLSIFADLQPEEKIDEIYVYHLTQRFSDKQVS